MNTTRIPPFFFYLFLCLIILFSFYNFAAVNFPLMNSDMALNALMAQGINIPGDLYFWGQDHGGSLVPLMANLLCVAYKFPPVMAVSVIQYFILIAGFMALSTFFRSRSLKLILAMVWFFPAWHFLDQVVNLYGIQMSLLVLAYFFFRKKQSSGNRYFQLAWLSLTCLALISSVWVSDLALVSIGLLALILFWKYFPVLAKDHLHSLTNDRNRLFQVILVLFFFILGTAFIFYAKSKAIQTEAYHTHHFNTPAEILSSIHVISINLFHVFAFCSENMVESIFAWSLLAGIPVIIWLSNTRNRFTRFCATNKGLVFFSMNGMVTFLLLLISHWVYINGTSRSYFSIVYISIWIAFLLYVESTGSRDRQLRMVVLTGIALIGSISSFSNFFVPERRPSRVSELAGFSKLGDAGIISEYRYAYLIASVHPKHIKATPHDKDHVRSLFMAEAIFRMPKLFLIRDGWMEKFPDTTMQFGHLIVRKGNPFRCCNLSVCRYERILFSRSFTCDEMQHQGTAGPDPAALSGRSVMIGKNFDHGKHFIYGPFLTLKQGTILVQFRLKSDPGFDTRTMAVLEISANYGRKILATQVIRSCDFQRKDAYQLFSLKTKLEKDYNGVEFRIMYQGGSELYFDRLELTGM
jgi:hypothetical protein